LTLLGIEHRPYASVRSITANYELMYFSIGCFLKLIALRYVTSRSRDLLFYVFKDMTWNTGCKVLIMEENELKFRKLLSELEAYLTMNITELLISWSGIFL
jgi:hypothetical protein